jgi:ATP-dependent Clp protease ATP-binding subunit ClpA
MTPVGQLMEYVRRNPRTIVFIEEIEKALREFVTLWASGRQ